jgi:hypothetical protein
VEGPDPGARAPIGPNRISLMLMEALATVSSMCRYGERGPPLAITGFQVLYPNSILGYAKLLY